MATRLEPYRDYSEHDVINMFSLQIDTADTLADFKAGESGKFDAGVVVTLGTDSNGDPEANLPGDLPGFAAAGSNLRKYLGAEITSGHVGVNAMPFVGMTVKPATSSGAIGITLKQTLAFDENDENLLRYPLKKDELQAVTPGQAVPILTRGLILLGAGAFEAGNEPAAGEKIMVSNTAGLLEKDSGSADQLVGTCIAVGSSDGGTTTDKYLCKLSF